MTIKKLFLIPGFIFIILSFYSAYLLRGDNEQNLINFLVVIIICVSTDIGGYFFGKLFKGPKITKISPNKTYAGFFGGFFLSIITFIIFVNNLEIFGFSNYKWASISLDLLFMIILISLVSQLGDIFVSYFKRLVKIKNTGKLLPGHGGLLDRIDGMIFAVPFAYLFLN
jgi:phosphatidate cytidylyltransferase